MLHFLGQLRDCPIISYENTVYLAVAEAYDFRDSGAILWMKPWKPRDRNYKVERLFTVLTGIS
jgi:hypothetical protein